MKQFYAFLLSFVFVSTASAYFVISPNISYQSTKVDQSQPAPGNSESTETLLDLRLGYVLPTGLYLGGMYAHSSTNDGTNSLSGFLAGPTIGYYSMTGFYAMLSYHILGEREINSTQKFTGGKGPQIDVGWTFPLTAYFSLGPQITWRSVEFDKLEGNAASVDADPKVDTIRPYLSLWFMF